MREGDRKMTAPEAGGVLRELADDPSSRKRFLSMVGGSGAAGALAILISACGGEEETTTSGEERVPGGPGDVSPGGDVQIVKFALLLELLEADFYEQVEASREVKDRAASQTIKLVAENEKEHVLALTATVEQLGATPVEPPKTDFKSVISGGEQKILETSALLENIGAAAYLGQVAKIQDPQILSSALSIHAVEARHAARFNELAGNGFTTGEELRGSIPDGAFAEPLEMDAVLELIQPFVRS